MAKITVEEQKEFPTLPDQSLVHLKVESTEIRTVQGQRGDWEKLEFTFKILGVLKTGDGSHPSNYENLLGEKIFGSVSYRLTDSPENKLRLWAEAILGQQMGLGFELDTDYLLRREVKGVTGTYEKKKSINPQTGKPFIGHDIRGLLPLGEIAASQPQQPVNQQQYQQQPAQAQGGWGAPGVQQQPQQQSWGQPQQPPPQQQPQPVGQPSQTPQDPWGPGPGSDEPPF